MLDVLVSRSAEQTEQDEDGAFIARHNPHPHPHVCSGFLMCVRPPRWTRRRQISQQGGTSRISQPLFAQI